MPAVLAFLIGASIGSFLNVVADRLPAGRSLVRPRSSCDTCHTVLSNTDNIPILSYLFLRGRCRYCGTGIPLRVLLVEIATASLFLALYFEYGLGARFGVMAGAASVLIAIAIINLDHQLILNKITFPAAVIVLALAPFWPELGFTRSFFGDGGALGAFLNSLLTGLAGFVFFATIALIRPDGMGWGDVKLVFVLGVFMGYPAGALAMWLVAVMGGVLAIWLIAFRRWGRKDVIPYGVLLAAGALVMVFAQEEAVSWYYEATASLGGVLV